MNVGTIFSELILDSSKYQAGLKLAQQQAGTSGKAMEQSLGHGPAVAMDLLHMKLRNLAGITAAAFSTHAIYAYAKEATMLASRLETMSVVLGIIGKNAGYTTGQMKDYVQQVKKMGITTSAAQDSLTKMAQANLDLSKAAQLARVSQDAAVIGNTNSSEAFQRMVYGIKTAQTEVLRTIGINVSFESSYAQLAVTLGKSTGALTQEEKSQARLQAVLREGIKIQGAYEAAMQTTAKLINSLPRYFEEVKEKIGELFSPALGVAVRALTEGLKDLGKTLENLSKSGELAVWAEHFASSLRTGIQAAKDFGHVVGTITSTIWNFKEQILILGAAFAAFKFSVWIAGMVAVGGAISNAFVAAAVFFALWSKGLITAGTAATIFGETVRAAFIKVSMGHPILLAITVALAAGALAWQKWGRAAEEASNKAVKNSEDDWIRFRAQLSQMKFSVVDPDEGKEYAKQLKVMEDATGKLSDKEKKILKERVSGFYEGTKTIAKFAKEINDLGSSLALPKTEDERKAIGLRIYNLLQMIEEIKMKQELAKLEAKDALVQQQALKDQAKKLEIEKNAEKITAQSHEAYIRSLKLADERYFLDRQKDFDAGIRMARESEVSEIDIAQRIKNEKIAVAEATYRRTMAIEEKIADEKQRLSEFGFKKSVYIDSKKLEASTKMYKEQEAAKKELETKVNSLNVESLEKQLSYDRQAYEKSIALEDAQFAHRQKLAELAGENEMAMIDNETNYKDQALRSWNYNQKAFAAREIEIERLKSVAAGREFVAKKELQERLAGIEKERQAREIKNLDEMNEKTKTANEKSLRSYKDYYTTLANSAGVSYEESKYYAGMAQTYELSLLASTKAQMIATGMTAEEWQNWFNLKALESTKSMMDDLIAKDTRLLDIMREYYGAFSGNIDNLIRLEIARNKLSVNGMTRELEMLKSIYKDEEANEIMSIILAERNHQSKNRILTDEANKHEATYAKIKGYEKKRYEWSLKQINLEAEEIKKLTRDEEAAEKYRMQRSREAYVQMGRDSNNFFAGVRAAMIENAGLIDSWGSVGYRVVQTFTRDATRILSTKFFKLVKGDFRDLFKVDWTNMLDNMLQLLTTIIAEMIVQWGLYKAAVFATTALGIPMPGGITNPLATAGTAAAGTAAAGAIAGTTATAGGGIVLGATAAEIAAAGGAPVVAGTGTAAAGGTAAGTAAGAPIAAAATTAAVIAATYLAIDYAFENFIWSGKPGTTYTQVASGMTKDDLWKLIDEQEKAFALLAQFDPHGDSKASQDAETALVQWKISYKDLWGKEWPQAKQGINYIPYDNYLVSTHKGEAVLKKEDAEQWRGNKNIHIHLEWNGREIGYAMATETETNQPLRKAIRRASIGG